VLVAIARSSDGALRDAESVLDQLISFAKDRVSHDDVISMLGLVEQAALFALTGRIIAHDARGALELLNEIINQGKDMSVLLSNLIEHFRNLMVAKVARADSELIDLPQNVCEKLMEQAGALSMEQIFSAFTVLMQAQDMSKRLDSLRIPLEICFVKLCHHGGSQNFSSARPLEAEAAPASKQPSRGQQAHHPHSPPVSQSERPLKHKPLQPSTPPQDVAEKPQGPQSSVNMMTIDAVQNVSLETVKEGWQRMIEDVSRVKISIASYLNEGVPQCINGNELTVVFPRNCSLHKETLEERIKPEPYRK